MINLLISGFFIVVLLSGCGWDGAPTRNNDFTPLTSIEIIAASPAIAAHTSTTLSVIGTFSGLYSRDITDQVVWSSGSPAVAGFITAGNPNRVTGNAPGTALLTATAGSISSAFTVTVSPATVTALTITPATSSIAKGLTRQYTVKGAFSDSTTQDLTFDATWASSAPTVATVSNVAGSKGFATARTAGSSTISATFGGINGSLELTVTEPVLQSITVVPANPSVLTLSSLNFKATGNYSDGSTADITSLAGWSSSVSSIATIGSGGTAATVAQGTTSISAAMAGISGTSNLKVTGGNLSAITLNPAAVTLVKGTAGRITATGTFSNGSIRDITGVVAWTPANTAIATVTAPGGNLAWLNALAVTPATALTTVTAKSGTVTAATNLIVTAPSLSSIMITPASADLTSGTSSRLTVTATFSDGTTQDVTAISDWSSNTVTTATVGNSGLAKGRVSGVAAGSATISAVYGGRTITAPVTVRTRTLQDLVVSGSSAAAPGNQFKCTAIANYSDGSSADVTEDAAWTINAPNVAILADSQNQPGQVVAVDSGSATLTASFGGKSKTTTITVP